MENFDEKFYEEDEFAENSGLITEPLVDLESNPESNPSETSEESNDLTSEVLRFRGINDPDKIKFEDESGAVIERSWDSLTRDEQINILAGEESAETALSSDEIELLNAIRGSGMSVSDYMNNQAQPTEPQTQESSYDIDKLSDDDLYALDLLEKVGSENITDEELNEAIKNAKSNEALYKKTVEGLRKEYIKLQQDEENRKTQEQARALQEAYNNFSNSIVNEIRGLNSFGGQDLELSQDDVDSLAAFILQLDDKGLSAFGKALQNPQLLTKAAFWLLNEDKIVEELTTLILDSYKRGYEMAKLDLSNKSKVVFAPSKKPVIEDKYADEFDW